MLLAAQPFSKMRIRYFTDHQKAQYSSVDWKQVYNIVSDGSVIQMLSDDGGLFKPLQPACQFAISFAELKDKYQADHTSCSTRRGEALEVLWRSLRLHNDIINRQSQSGTYHVDPAEEPNPIECIPLRHAAVFHRASASGINFVAGQSHSRNPWETIGSLGH